MSPPRRRSGGVDHRARAPSARGPPRHRDRRLARLGASGVADRRRLAQPRVESTMARGSARRTRVTSVTPIMRRASVSGIFIGPGDGAAPGAGWGKAVDIAVWNRTLPSTFVITWWMWPLSTVTDPKRFTLDRKSTRLN